MSGLLVGFRSEAMFGFGHADLVRALPWSTAWLGGCSLGVLMGRGFSTTVRGPMPTPPASQSAPAETNEPLYPAVEGFIERATPEEVDGLFQPIKQGLEGLKGPKVEQAKKVKASLVRTEELLHHLIEVREKLTAEKKGGKGR